MKYDPLKHYLINDGRDIIRLSYSEIENIIKSKLPSSAYQYPAFWGKGDTHVWIYAINSAGYKVNSYSIADEWVELTKGFEDITRIVKKEKKRIPDKNQFEGCILFNDSDLNDASDIMHADTTYGSEECLLRDALIRFPKNNDRVIVAMKVGLIEITNSTHISQYKSKINAVEIVDILLGIEDLDKRISEGDPTLVEEISEKAKNIKPEQGGVNLFSFASKFCCYHNLFVYDRDDYSIYDSKLREHLVDYDKSCTERVIKNWVDSFDYISYNDAIKKILDRNHITVDKARRKFDNMVWYKNR